MTQDPADPATDRPPAAQVDRNDLVMGLGSDGVTRPFAVDALRAARVVSVRDLGAVGDGRSHPLSERYPDLAAARRDYPHAASLADEIDWAATQAAINLVRDTGGGTVAAPAGRYVCNRTLTFPECREFGERGQQVNWIGEGIYASVYHWPKDLGAGAFAVLCPRRREPDGMYEGLWQDIGLEGPGAAEENQVLGEAPAGMDGWGWGARRRMTRCSARRFRAGLDIVGDHARFEDVVSRENLYAVYFSRPSESLFGDLLFEKCMFSGCTLAAIAVHPAAQMGGCTLISCYVGGAPYSILKEAGAGDAVMLSNSVFLNCMFEYVGNAWLHDANAPRRAAVRIVTFDTCYFQWRDDTRLPRAPRAALWDIHRAEHVRWLQLKEPFALLPGDEALLKVEIAQSCEIVGHISHIVSNCEEAGRPFLHAVAARADAYRSWRLAEPGSWEGRFVLVAPGSPRVRPGDVLERAPGGRVRRGTRSDMPVAGICQTSGGPGALVVAAVSGPALPVRCPSGTADAWLVKGPDGTAAAAGPDHAGPLIGLVVGWSHAAEGDRAVVDVGPALR